MQVFKTVFKVTFKKLPSICIYIGTLIIIMMLLTSSGTGDGLKDFEPSNLKICIVDNDNSEASKNLTDYLGEIHELKSFDTTDENVVLDKLYYRSVDYVLTINKGFEEKLKAGETDDLFESQKLPSSFTSQFLETQLTQYVSDITAFVAGGYTVGEAMEKSSAVLENATEVKNISADSQLGMGPYWYYNYLPYILISVVITALTPVLMTMLKPEIYNRTKCSAVPATKYMFNLIKGSTVIVLGIWLILTGISVAMYPDEMLSGNGARIILNSFVFLITVYEIAMIISQFAKKSNVVDMMANVIGLGMSFLCGLFVPQYLLSDGVLAVAKFLPAYWYVKANNMIGGVEGAVFESKTYVTCIGVQVLFALALLGLILIFNKARQQQNSI